MLTKLPEIAQRLENFYGHKYGEKNLVIIKDSKQVFFLSSIFKTLFLFCLMSLSKPFLKYK